MLFYERKPVFFTIDTIFMKIRKLIVCFAIVFLLPAVGGLAVTKEGCAMGNITYPALGNIELNEGTVEAWITLCFDPNASTTRKWWLRALFFDSCFSGKDSFKVSWAIEAGKKGGKKIVNSGIKVSLAFKGIFLYPMGYVIKKKELWKENTCFHYAVTWKGKRMKLFINGKQVNEVKQSFAMNPDILASSKLFIGGRYSNAGRFIVDEFRISSVAREPRELGFYSKGPLKPDAYTLLLDNFDHLKKRPGGGWISTPQVTADDGGRQAVIAPSCRVVPGKYGNGIALFTPIKTKQENPK